MTQISFRISEISFISTSNFMSFNFHGQLSKWFVFERSIIRVHFSRPSPTPPEPVHSIQFWQFHLQIFSFPEIWPILFFLDLQSDPNPFVKSGSTIRSDPFTLLWKGSTIRSFPILFDPFRSDHYRLYLRVWFHKSCIFGFSQGARLRDLCLTRLQDLTKLWFY